MLAVVAVTWGCGRSVSVLRSGELARPGSLSGTLRIAGDRVDNLNPVLSGGGASTYLSYLWGAWLFVAGNENQLEPELATVIPSVANGGISKDGLQITYHLRRGVRWQDGYPFDASDVVFTWRAIMNPKNNVVTRLGYEKIATMTAIDRYTVRVRLKEPYAPAVASLFGPGEVPMCILPRHILQGGADINQAPYNAKPVGAGPFAIDRYEPSTGVLLKANPTYWRGKPKLAAIRYLFIPDPNTVQVMMRTGELDVALLNSLHSNELAGEPHIAIIQAPANEFWFLSFNERHPPLDDARVRRAIAMAVDRRAFLHDILRDHGSIADSDQPPFLWSYNPQVRAPGYDVAGAEKLLDESGWRRQQDGARYKNGRRLALSFVYVRGSSDPLHYAPIFQNAMHRIAVDVEIKPYPYSLFYAQKGSGGILNGGKYDIAYTGWVGGVDPDDATLWMCDQFPPNGYNSSFSCDRRIDAQERVALRSYDQAVRRKAYWKIQELLAIDVPVAFLVWSDTIYGIPKGLHGFHATTNFTHSWEWQLSQEGHQQQ
ncbi:MAG: hypothetical protein GIX00_03870 [Candidatus Eremiobacteraeota bacterium]|nr:hypothetical protein [Candidatus Eremiobacteraeota bacterium]